MNPVPESPTLFTPVKQTVMRSIRAFYRTCIDPKTTDEDTRRRELIFNIIASSLFFLLCLLDLSVLYSDITKATKGGFGFFTFSIFVAFFGCLLLLSRKGHTDLAAHLFIGFYFIASTYGLYIWGIAVPLSLLSYGAIIVMTSILLGTRAGLMGAVGISATLVTLGYLETHGVIHSDIRWRFTSLSFKDTLEDTFVYAMIVTVSWLSNRELEKSLVKTRESEKALKRERDLLEVKVEERTRALKAAELEKVSQLYKFVEFGRLASGIFHDLLNPLSVVALSVEKLNDSGDENQKQTREYIDRAIRASKRMEVFMRTARKQLDSRERSHPFSANREIADAVSLLIHKSHKMNVTVTHIDGQEVTLYGNPVKFFQIAVNLLSNAIDSHSDKIEINPVVTVSVETGENSARLIVSDNGCGIKDSLRKSIFEPFFTTKQDRPREESGFGLGLSTTKDIVERDFDGKIEIESTENKGTKFMVIIPTPNLKQNAETQSHRSETDIQIDRPRS